MGKLKDCNNACVDNIPNILNKSDLKQCLRKCAIKYVYRGESGEEKKEKKKLNWKDYENDWKKRKNDWKKKNMD